MSAAVPSLAPTLTLRVARRWAETPEISAFELRDPEGRALPAFEAGAHLDVRLPGGLIRQYSLCNAPGERDRYLIAVLRDPQSRGGSAALHAHVQAGDLLCVGAPRNHFALVPGARHHLLLAGGIGVTPLLAMAEQLSALAHGADADPGRPSAGFELHLCVRSRERAPFLARLAASPFADRVHLHADDGPAAQRLRLDDVLGAPRPDTHLYVCGPRGFMDAVLATAAARGWPAAQCHSEAFSAAPADAARPVMDTGSFELRLARSQRRLTVAADESIVSALARIGIEVPTSCGEGLCGTCITPVLAGEPEHRDLVLSAAEQTANRSMAICCSRARSASLTLDL